MKSQLTKSQQKDKETYKHKKVFTLNKLLNPTYQANIIYFEALINYTILHFNNGKQLKSSYTINIFETILSQHNFFRIHKKYLINESHIKEVKESKIILTNDITLTPSRRKQYTKKTA